VKLRRIDQFVERALINGVFPSATLLAVDEGQIKLHRSYGRADLDAVYDLASLTKPLATTALVMQLVASNELRLRDPLGRLLPDLAGTPLAPITIWQLLSHTAGLQAHLPYYLELRHLAPARARRRVRRLVLRTPLAQSPGRGTIYSDLGFMLLGWVVEQVASKRLHLLLRERICAPLGLRRLTYLPAPGRRAAVAYWPLIPTERCPWRKRRLLGEVHDDNCFVTGGVEGHAGLFGTAHEIDLLLRQLIAAYHGRPSIFAGPVVRKFWNWSSGRTHRALGWDRPLGQDSAAGRLLAPDAVGHLGFTGGSLWVEPARERWLIFLSNRVYHGRLPNPMRSLRASLNDLMIRALDNTSGHR
jgi:CubicO group peptidase (beta-lactamase class C family)